eukprot:978763-Heterocapsa_arctica.AAC.1
MAKCDQSSSSTSIPRNAYPTRNYPVEPIPREDQFRQALSRQEISRFSAAGLAERPHCSEYPAKLQ